MSSRRIFVGDIQGCLEPLDRLLAELAFVPGVDVLLPAGDLVNKGPDSEGVLRRLIEIKAQPVLGNHDLHWLETKGRDFPDLAVWLREQPFIRIHEDLILVHAGLHPNWSEERMLVLDEAEQHFAVNVRYCDALGQRPPLDWPVPSDRYVPWDEHYTGDKLVVFGHWARRGFDRTDKVIALDSGCVYGKTLTAWIAEEDRVVQVPGQA